MRSIWVGIYPRPHETRVLAMAGPNEVLLKARLSTEARHPRALQTLLEALALWQGEPVRAALCVDERAGGCGTSLCRDWFADEVTPLYTLDVVPVHRRRRRDGLGGMGDFGDLRRLVIREVAR